jgi:hypothetical protein
MSLTDIHDLLGRSINDEVVLKHFASVWAIVERTLDGFSKVTGLPIFVYFQEQQIFASSLDTMPDYCQVMLRNSATHTQCTEDGLRRATLKVRDLEKNVQMCHAGMINGRREIETAIGNITILFGSIKSSKPIASQRREEFIQIQTSTDRTFAEKLADSNSSESNPDISSKEFFEKDSLVLIDAICDLVGRLLKSTVGFRVLTINMAHELTFALGELGHVAEYNMEVLNGLAPHVDKRTFDEIHSLNSILIAECRLGLYLVRNILSHTSEKTYSEVIKPSFSMIDLKGLLAEMVELYQWRAREKEIFFEVDSLETVPQIRGLEMEIRRAFHNILNNALKYSYHSVDTARRIVRIRFKVPYDPGFQTTRFAIIFENYGLGLTDEEQRMALKAGFRGRQAINEVPIGAGIGLSEVEKVMRIHKGSVKITSRALHSKGDADATYLTEVKLIFPYKGD